jgi:hypothetical protein
MHAMVCRNRASCWIDWMEFDDASQSRLGIPQPYDCGCILFKLNCVLIHTSPAFSCLLVPFHKIRRQDAVLQPIRPLSRTIDVSGLFLRKSLDHLQPILAASTFRTTYSSAFLILSLFFQHLFLQHIASPRLFNSDGGLYRHALRGRHQAFSSPFGLELHRSLKGSDTSECAC